MSDITTLRAEIRKLALHLQESGDSTWRPFGRRYGYSAAWADAEIDKAMSVAAQESKS